MLRFLNHLKDHVFQMKITLFIVNIYCESDDLIENVYSSKSKSKRIVSDLDVQLNDLRNNIPYSYNKM